MYVRVYWFISIYSVSIKSVITVLLDLIFYYVFFKLLILFEC
jgi:hypothetical protein